MVPADEEEYRQIARRIDEQSPGWLVVWGVYTRQFVAFPLFDAPRGTIVTAGYPDALTGRMGNAERAWHRPPGHQDHP